tara:strand:+ start:211 stop:450 length:240 start_codon:yes stop_codon:yes gene_type:complete
MNAIVKHAAALNPNELENRSSVKPKMKLININVILFILVGKVKIKVRHIRGSYIPNKSKLLKTIPCKRIKKINLLITKK